MTTFAQAPVSHEWDAQRVHSRRRSRRARPAGGRPRRGVVRREDDKDSLSVASPTAVRRLGCREGREGFAYLPSQYHPAGGGSRGGRDAGGAPCPPSRRSSIRRPIAQPDRRGWSCAVVRLGMDRHGHTDVLRLTHRAVDELVESQPSCRRAKPRTRRVRD